MAAFFGWGLADFQFEDSVLDYQKSSKNNFLQIFLSSAFQTQNILLLKTLNDLDVFS